MWLYRGQVWRSAGGIAFDEEEFVFADIFAFAVGQFAGQDGDRRLPFFFSIFYRTHPRLCLTDGEFGDFLPKSTFWFSHNSKGSPDTAATSFSASRLVSLSLV